MTSPKVRLIVRYLPDAPEFTRLAVNDEYCRVFGVERKDVIGLSALTFKPKHRRANMARKLNATVMSGRAMLSIGTYYRSNGGRIKMRWIDVPVLNSSGSNQVVEIIAIGEIIE